MGYNGYLITGKGRVELLSRVSPLFKDVIAHHVTHEFGVSESLPPDAKTVEVFAVAQNDKVQAALVKVNGSTNRPGGKTYHITISIDREAGAKPVDSNTLIADKSTWTSLEPFEIDVVPSFFER